MPNQNKPQKNKATTKSAKKGKAVKRTVTSTAPFDHESDWTLHEDEPSMKEMFSNLTTMMSSLSTSMDQMDGGGRKKRKVAFHRLAPTPETSSLPDVAHASTTHLPPSRPQNRLAPTPSVPQQPFLPGADHVSPEAPFQEGARPHLPDVSKVVQTRVAQHLQGAPIPFLLTDEDSPTDEEASLNQEEEVLD